MIEQADQNGDGVIDRGEFQQCYASLPWSRVQGLSVLLHEIKSTWRLFDENGDGSITTDELRQVFASMKLNLTVEEIDRMVVAADANGDGEISYIEFVQAFHSPQWRKARALGMAQSRLQVFESEQHKMYEELAESEKQQVLDEGEQGTIEGVDVNKTQLMRRRALRRHPAVQASIGKLWHALSALKVDGEFISKDLYLTYHLKIARALDKREAVVQAEGNKEDEERDDERGSDLEEEGDPEARSREQTKMARRAREKAWRDKERRQEAEEDWSSDCRKARLSTDEASGDGLDQIGYSLFYDSLFELADVEHGRDRQGVQAEVSGRMYADFIQTVVDLLVVYHGDGKWGWKNDLDVYTRQREWNEADAVDPAKLKAERSWMETATGLAQKREEPEKIQFRKRKIGKVAKAAQFVMRSASEVSTGRQELARRRENVEVFMAAAHRHGLEEDLFGAFAHYGSSSWESLTSAGSHGGNRDITTMTVSKRQFHCMLREASITKGPAPGPQRSIAFGKGGPTGAMIDAIHARVVGAQGLEKRHAKFGFGQWIEAIQIIAAEDTRSGDSGTPAGEKIAGFLREVLLPIIPRVETTGGGGVARTPQRATRRRGVIHRAFGEMVEGHLRELERELDRREAPRPHASEAAMWITDPGAVVASPPASLSPPPPKPAARPPPPPAPVNKPRVRNRSYERSWREEAPRNPGTRLVDGIEFTPTEEEASFAPGTPPRSTQRWREDPPPSAPGRVGIGMRDCRWRDSLYLNSNSIPQAIDLERRGERLERRRLMARQLVKRGTREKEVSHRNFRTIPAVRRVPSAGTRTTSAWPVERPGWPSAR